MTAGKLYRYGQRPEGYQPAERPVLDPGPEHMGWREATEHEAAVIGRARAQQAAADTARLFCGTMTVEDAGWKPEITVPVRLGDIL